MSTTRLRIYNDALLICGERFLSSLTEEQESRRLLDHVWDNEGVKNCLEAGQWNFAMRSVMINYDPTIDPDFGYNRGFPKPTDWVLTCAVCEDEYFSVPLLQYLDTAGYWFADIDDIYVKYVSDDTQYGMDLSLWPSSFQDYVSAHFATKIIGKLSGAKPDKIKMVFEYEKQALKEAKNRSAMAGPTMFLPQGKWVQAMRGRNRSDRGGRGSLIG